MYPASTIGPQLQIDVLKEHLAWCHFIVAWCHFADRFTIKSAPVDNMLPCSFSTKKVLGDVVMACHCLLVDTSEYHTRKKGMILPLKCP